MEMSERFMNFHGYKWAMRHPFRSNHDGGNTEIVFFQFLAQGYLHIRPEIAQVVIIVPEKEQAFIKGVRMCPPPWSPITSLIVNSQ
ncbi:unnamed protein product, partial [marine sediment metagenome]